MVISCIGDSLTEGDYGIYGKNGIANVKEKNYPYFLSEIAGCKVRNYGKCGFKASQYLDYYKSGAVNLDNSDYIIIMLGTNGGHDEVDMSNKENRAYFELVNLCRRDVSGAKIIVCTPPYATKNPDYSNFGYAEQVETAVRFVRNFAKQENLPMIDVAKCTDFCEGNEPIMQPNDGLHFGEVGYKRLAQFIAENM